MNDAMRNAIDDYAANIAAPRSLGVREIAQNNTGAMREILSNVDVLLEALRGTRNAEACDGARVANPEGLLSEVNRQAGMLDEINRGIIAAIATLNG